MLKESFHYTNDVFEKSREKLLENGMKESVQTISVLKANLMALVTAGPIAILLTIIYFFTWSADNIIFISAKLSGFIIFLVLMTACIVIHELIHGLTWCLFCKNGFKSIHFGVIWNALTPYCYCEESLAFGAYITGGLMPLIILGFGFFILSMSLGSNILFFISLINVLAAGGDMTIALMLLKFKNAVILDHPTECGFVAFTK